jgi:cytochrome c-type biogenesis protein CcmE
LGGLVIVGLIVYLVASSISSAGAYYREVGEVLAEHETLIGKSLRVSGNVVTESVVYDAPTLSLSFRISDTADASRQVPVHFRGVQPDQIGREGASAIVEGTLGADGTVEASNLLLKCPSKYEEYEEIEVTAVQ